MWPMTMAAALSRVDRVATRASARSRKASADAATTCTRAAAPSAGPAAAVRTSAASAGAVEATAAKTASSAAAGCPAHVGEIIGERLGRLRIARERSQDVQGDDVPRALPDRHHRLLPEPPCERERLRVAVAAQALECLVGVMRPALADP